MIKLISKSMKQSKKVKEIDEKEKEKQEQNKRYLEMERRIKQAEEKRILNPDLMTEEPKLNSVIAEQTQPAGGEISKYYFY